MKPKIRPSVSVVKLNNNIIEFFLCNTRKSFKIKVKDSNIAKIIVDLDGTKTLEELKLFYNMEEETYHQFCNLIKELEKRHVIVDEIGQIVNDYDEYRRPIHLLEDYATSREELKYAWNNIRNSKVVIVGLGAVGTWIALTLAQSGVKNFIIIDGDKVESSNLHRQLGYYECNIGEYKVDALEKRLHDIDDNINVIKIKYYLENGKLENYINEKVDLIINCADKPDVDTTSKWIGMYCMKNSIPHIIAGGYNLHLSLIGQTIIPFETACVRCFERQLEKESNIQLKNVKKMYREDRKIGSFGPMCAISASIASMEAIKVLSRLIPITNKNRRGEFNFYSMDIFFREYVKDIECEWCGKDGIYSREREI